MRRLAIASVIALSACSVQSGEVADAASTAAVLAGGGVELNPLFSNAGSAAPVVGFVATQAGKAALVASGYEQETVDSISNSLGWGAACSNFIALGGGTGPIGLAAGLACVAFTWEPVQ